MICTRRSNCPPPSLGDKWTGTGNPQMEFSNDPAAISAWAAVISALCALISIVFSIVLAILSRRPSRRDMIDELKIEILQVVSSVQGQEAWIETLNSSKDANGGVRDWDLVNLLSPKFQKEKWVKLFPVALEELRKENYHKLLGMPPIVSTHGPMEIIAS